MTRYSPTHVHDGEWCAKCVEHGRATPATPDDPAGFDLWEDLLREFPTKRDAKIRALIEKHRPSVYGSAPRATAAEPEPDLRAALEAAKYVRVSREDIEGAIAALRGPTDGNEAIVIGCAYAVLWGMEASAATPERPAGLAECGFNEPHEPHTVAVAVDDKPADLECPGLPERPAGLDVERLAAVINDGIRNGRSDHEIARDVLALAARLSETGR